MLPLSIPSPEQGVWHVGPIPLRAYALLIILGIFVGVVIGERRWATRGGRKGDIGDLAIWAVPFGIIGARLYHVLTDWQTYFGPGGSGLVPALKIWQGGLGIWGAVAGGALGAWIGCRRRGILLPPVADAIAPGLAVAQAIGRFGNYFNQELFGRPTSAWWGLEIAPQNRPAGYEQFATFHPTFLYESLWCLAVAGIVIWADKRFKLGHGRAFALYVALYCLGRLAIEAVRIDTATVVAGLRINIWTSLLIGLAAAAYVVVVGRLRPGREPQLYRPGSPAAIAAAGAGAGQTGPAGADDDDPTGSFPGEDAGSAPEPTTTNGGPAATPPDTPAVRPPDMR